MNSNSKKQARLGKRVERFNLKAEKTKTKMEHKEIY